MNNPTLDSFIDLLHEKFKEFQQHDDELKQKWVVTFLAAVVLVLNLSYYWKKSTMSKRFGMPVMHSTPQGRSFPYLGQAINFIRYRPWDLLTNWHRLYGPIVCFPLLGATMFSIGSPALMKVVLQSKIAAVKKDIANTMKPFLTILGTGIVTSEDESWMKQRLKMSNPLRRDVLEIIPRQTLLAVQRLMLILDKAAEEGNEVPIGSSLRHLTLQVISGSFLSLSAEESDSTFAEMYLPIVDESNTRVWHPYRSYLFFLPFFWRYISNVQRLNQYVSKLIRDRWALRRKEQKHGSDRENDILDRVLQVYEKEFPKAQILPDSAVRQFRDEMKTFMLAGHETSAAMMTWTLYELMGNNELMQRVADEGESVFGSALDWSTANASDLPVPDDVARLVLSEASLKVRDADWHGIAFGGRVDGSAPDCFDYFLLTHACVPFFSHRNHCESTRWSRLSLAEQSKICICKVDTLFPRVVL
jgi:cytochrome P450